jgi:hypothetical protein
MDQKENQENNGAAVAARLSHLQRDKEPNHPGASAQQQARGSMTGLSFSDSLRLGLSSTSNEGVVLGGRGGIVEDTSLVVAKSALKPSAVQLQHDRGTKRSNETLVLQEQQADMPPHGFLKPTPAKAHELMLSGGIQAQQRTRAVAPELQVGLDTSAGNVVDTKEDNVGDTKAAKVESASTKTQRVMPNRNICIPLVPLPRVCSR